MDNAKLVSFYVSSELDLDVTIKIQNLIGDLKLPSTHEDPELRYTSFHNSLCTDLYVSCAVFADGRQLTLPVRTREPVSVAKNTFRWNEGLRLPIKYQDLPQSSQLAVTVWNVVGPRRKAPVGGATLSLFGRNRCLRRGRQRLTLWPTQEADGSLYTSTPGKQKNNTEKERLEKLLKRFDRGDIPRVDWLDRATLAIVDNFAEQGDARDDDALTLYVELPSFEHPVVFHEKEAEIKQPALSHESDRVVILHEPALQNRESNPISTKHLKLVSSYRRKLVDPNLKPSLQERDHIERILKYPISKQLSVEDKDILWKFRFYLTSNRRALTKFLRCVDWNNAQETKQAADLIQQWEPIEISDALELLGKSFSSFIVRDYAVSVLEHASNEELLCYLLQLVQALRYESAQHESRLMRFLIARAMSREAVDFRNYLYWYLRVECEDTKFQAFYQKKLALFVQTLNKTEEGLYMVHMFKRQEDLIKQLGEVYKELRRNTNNRKKKTQRFVEILSPGGPYASIGKMPVAISLPVQPFAEVNGVIFDKLRIFSSSLEPLGIRFVSKGKGDEKEWPVIFKSGDDLRQDQLVIQLISLMDRLLKRENLDLKLTPYKVLSTSTHDGMVEWVDNSHTIGAVLKEYSGDIQNYLRKFHPDTSAKFGIDPAVINNFIRSCAGYCVITYILVVGDRHLDNLLITQSGRLFHIDFGFIGRDPKPYPPPMKLCTEMVNAMGGADSKEFTLFRQLCVEAYNILRKNANLILNLISLMADANIPDIGSERSILQIQERFQLDKNDEEAGQSIQKLMQESVTALFPRLSENIHKWKQYWQS